MKEFCRIHHFFYKTKKCPLCEQERLENLAKKFVVIDHPNVIGNYKQERLENLAKRFVVVDHLDVIGNYKPKTSNDIEITEEHLKKLTEKFNVKKK